MDFKNEKTSIIAISKIKTTQYESDYEVVKYLLFQGLAFRGHDESERSLNKGNYL